MDLDLPPLYLLPTHMTAVEAQAWTARLPEPPSDLARVDIVVGKISQRQRAIFELRKLGLPTDEYTPARDQELKSPHRAKKRKISDSEYGAPVSGSDTDTTTTASNADSAQTRRSSPGTVKVVRLAWLEQSLSKGRLLDYHDYIVYEAVKAPKPVAISTPGPDDLMRRAREVAAGSSQTLTPSQAPYHKKHRGAGHNVKAPALVPHSTTEEHTIASMPPIPECLKTSFSCMRSTRVHPPNEAFVNKLREVRELRAAQGDDIGVRAYSSAIASLSAYPYHVQSALEVGRLPGCGSKFVRLFEEFQMSGELGELQAAASDPKISVILTFYNIWGVSDATAQEFYRKGWRDLDDIVEFGWDLINRSQQIGIKYYDEFLQKIPRSETESIASIILEHANKLSKGFHLTVVGGYRRGKTMSGDVDVVLSHPDERATYKCIKKLVESLINAQYITFAACDLAHTLQISEHNSERGQRPTSFKRADPGGTGFDTLDKALVVWQNPEFKGSDKNPNPHRRVDIIISPWRTVGCAVLGWTSATTFQRDLRRYCKEIKELKFDSSGIRSRRAPFDWVDFEDGGKGPPATMEEAERRVFEGLGLTWRPPEERCTG
ncbi:hypothetical protein BD289DRAFT_476695 [Coniella lustricola]|uniref:DNA polymerase n=1 Tax=Coniella lustricola TaxID=2025994 RepID=A0A2T2ZXM7_9PEZI|nr:hypothetical protein BD289DRAFT_476695 [Coniella lustricola]